MRLKKLGRSIGKTVITFMIHSVLFLIGCTETTIPAYNAEPEVVKGEEWTEIDETVYVFSSDFYLANAVLVVSGKEAILVDTGENETDREKIERFLHERKLTLKNIIITHMHSDHVANLDAFKTEEMAVITPENAMEGQTITVGEKTLKVTFTEGHYQPGGHISVEVLELNLLIAGDVFCNNILPPIAAGGELEALLATLERLKKAEYRLIVPGHGEVEDSEIIFERQLEYLNNAKERVEQVLVEQGNEMSLLKIKLEDCIQDTSYLFERNLKRLHQETLKVIYRQLSETVGRN